MQDFLKGIKNKISDVGKKSLIAPTKAINAIGDFFKPKADEVRVRDVVREIPGQTLNVAKDVARGATRFAYSAGEAVGALPVELTKVINPGANIKVPIYEPEKVPGLGFLGPIESYQNQFKRETAEGKNKGVGVLKAAGNIAMDEPVGVALKPVGIAFGGLMKSGAGKAIEKQLAKIVETIKPEAVKTLLGKIGIGEKAALELAEPLANAKTLDEVKGILGYTEKGGSTKVPKKQTTLYHTTTPESAKGIIEKGFNIDIDPEKRVGRAFGDGAYFSTTKDEAEAWKQFLTKDDGEVLDLSADLNLYDPKTSDPALYWDKLAKKAGVKSNPELGQEIADAYMMGKGAMESDVYDEAIQRSQEIIKKLQEKGIDGAKFVEPIDASEGIVNPQVVVFNVSKVNDALKAKPVTAAAKIKKTATKAKDTLIEEAKKYNSADEFANSQPVLYHGSDAADIIRDQGFKLGETSDRSVGAASNVDRLGKGIYFADKIDDAKRYARSWSTDDVVEAVVKPGTNIKKFETYDEWYNYIKDRNPKALTKPELMNKMFEKEGFGGVSLGGDTVVFDPKNITTKEKLAEVWSKSIPKAEAAADTGTAKSIGEIIKENGGKLPPPEAPRTMGDMIAPKGAERKFITRIKAEEPGMADLLKGQYDRKSNTVLVENADKLIKENYAAAETMARTGIDDQAVAVASRMIEDELNIAKKATDEATKNKAYEKAAEIANDAARNLTEAGRAVQAASLLGKMTPEGMARYAARKIQKYNEEAGKRTMTNFLGGAKKIPELSKDQLKEIADGMEQINKMADGTDKARALQKLGEKIQSYIPSTLYQKIINVWKAGLLTGLKTTGVNVASNVSHSASEIIKDIPAAFVDKIASLFTGKRTLALTGKGTGEGTLEGIKKGWDYLKTGFDERNIAGKLDYHKVNFGKGRTADVLKKYTDTVFGLLGAEDQPFYYAARARSMANQAIAMAKNQGLKGKAARDFAQKMIENPTEDMMKYSILDAETAVFQQDSWLAKKAQNLQKGLEIVLPFAKTPANVATAMINYTPVGIVKTIIENIGKGRFDQRLFSQGIGRGVTGTAAVAIGAALMANKLMNLTTPTSEKERKQWELEGRIPNSIKINGKWRNIGVLGPLGMVLIVGGHLQDGMDKTGSFAGGLTQAAGGFGSALTEQSFLSGVNKTIDALKDPTRSFNGWASSIAGSIVPTLLADAARAGDQYERRTDGMIERIQSRIPGAREGLEPQVDTFGNKKETPNFFEVMADPTRPGIPSADLKDPVVMELRRLMDNDVKVTPTQLGPTGGYKSLTPEQNTKLWTMAGQVLKAEMEKVMRGRQYATYDDEQKGQVLDKQVSRINTEARARIVIEALKGLSDAEQKAKLAEMKEEGLLTKSVFSMYLSLKKKK